MPTASLLELRDVHARFPVQSGVLQRTVGHVHALDGVNLTVRRGETIGLVGEVGMWKVHTEPRRDDVAATGFRRSAVSRDAIWRRWIAMRDKLARRDIQIIFQDSLGITEPTACASET